MLIDFIVFENGLEACSLPRVTGPCEGNYPSWYHDTATGTCRQFRYGGCLGNNNRFNNRQDCETQCLAPKMLGKTPSCAHFHLASCSLSEQFLKNDINDQISMKNVIQINSK